MTYSLRQFGARPVENGGGDMAIPLESAIDSGEALEVPHGQTFLTGTPLRARSRLILGGTGTLKLANGTNGMLLDCENAFRTQISDVQFDGNGVNQTVGAPVVRLRNCAYARLRDLYIFDGKEDGLVLENYNGSSQADEINVNNCHSFFAARDGFSMTYSRATAVGTVSCTAGAATFSASQAGIAMQDQVIVVGGTPYYLNTFNGTYGATLSGSPTFAASAFTFGLQPMGDCVIRGNHLNYSGRYGGYNRAGSSNIVDVNNILTNAGHGWFSEGIPGEAGVNRATFTGNKFRNNGGDGFYQYGGGTLYVNAGLIFTHNECHYNNAYGGASECDIWDTHHVTIANNYFGANPGFAARALYGLQLSRVTEFKRGGNQYFGNVTGDYIADGYCAEVAYGT